MTTTWEEFQEAPQIENPVHSVGERPISPDDVFLDPNGGIKRNGHYELKGFKKGNPKIRVKKFTMEDAYRLLAGYPPGNLFCELAILSNGKGVTEEWKKRVEKMGWVVWTCSTRCVPHYRIPHHGWVDEDKTRPAAKRDGCVGCTMADIDALERLSQDMTTYKTGKKLKWFYNYNPHTKRCGSKNHSGSLAARCNTRLNDLRFGSQEDRDAFKRSCPAWLLERFPNEDAFVVVENIVVTFQEVIKTKGASRRMFLKALGNYANARRCQQHSTWNFRADIRKEYRPLVTPAAKELWRLWKLWKTKQPLVAA